MTTALEFGKRGTVSALLTILKQNGVKFVSIRSVTGSGIVFARNSFMNSYDDEDSFVEGVTIPTVALASPIMLDTVPRETGITGSNDLRLVGDLNTLRLPSFNKTRAVMFGNIFNPDGTPSDLCPRFLLQNQIKQCMLQHNGMKVMVGAEIEFTLTKRMVENGHSIPITNSHYSVSSDLDDYRDLIEDMCDWLDSQGVQVEKFHGEYGKGQFEVVIRYTDPVELADSIIIAKEILRQVSRKYDYDVCFLPQPLEGYGFNNDLHLHLSILNNAGENVFYDHDFASDSQKKSKFTPSVDAISIVGKRFIAGILDHIHALAALTTPSTNSFRRESQGKCASNFGVWGYDNRQAPIRVCSAMTNDIPRHFEFRMHDSTSNPYLALCGLIAAGFDGISKGMSLPEEVTGDPSSLVEEQRAQLGIEMLPQTPLVALELLENDTVLINALGESMSKCYIAVRKHEANYFQKLTVKEEIAEMRQRGF